MALDSPTCDLTFYEAGPEASSEAGLSNPSRKRSPRKKSQPKSSPSTSFQTVAATFREKAMLAWDRSETREARATRSFWSFALGRLLQVARDGYFSATVRPVSQSYETHDLAYSILIETARGTRICEPPAVLKPTITPFVERGEFTISDRYLRALAKRDGFKIKKLGRRYDLKW